MKQFLIRYRFAGASEADWHAEVARFIAALDADPDLGGKIGYRCLKSADGGYYHLASAPDDAAVAVLQSRDYFKHYTEQTRLAGGGQVEVSPIEVVAETGRAR